MLNATSLPVSSPLPCYAPLPPPTHCKASDRCFLHPDSSRRLRFCLCLAVHPTHPVWPGPSSANMTAPADDDKCRGGEAITESARCSMQALAALLTSRLWRVLSSLLPHNKCTCDFLNGGTGRRRMTHLKVLDYRDVFIVCTSLSCFSLKQ